MQLSICSSVSPMVRAADGRLCALKNRRMSSRARASQKCAERAHQPDVAERDPDLRLELGPVLFQKRPGAVAAGRIAEKARQVAHRVLAPGGARTATRGGAIDQHRIAEAG
jgi:hypothetical protein